MNDMVTMRDAWNYRRSNVLAPLRTPITQRRATSSGRTTKYHWLGALLWMTAFEPSVLAHGRAFDVVRADTEPQSIQVLFQGQTFAIAGWTNEISFSIEDASYAWSMDHGVTWRGGVRFPYEDYGSEMEGAPSFCADSSRAIYALGVYKAPIRDEHGVHEGLSPALFRGSITDATFQWNQAGPILLRPFARRDSAEELDAAQIATSGGKVLYAAYVHQTHAYTPRMISQVEFQRSEDAGLTWSPPASVSGPVSHGPRLVARADTVFVFWYDLAASTLVSRKSVDAGRTFGPEIVVSPVQPNEGADTPGGRSTNHPHHDPRYHCTEGLNGLTFAQVAVDNSKTARNGTLYAAWAERAEGTAEPPTISRGEIEPNDTSSSATRIEIGSTIAGTADSRDFNPTEDDLFVFHAEGGEVYQLEGRLTAIYPPGPGTNETCYALFVCQPGTPLVPLSMTYMQLDAGGISPPCLFSVPHTGDYFVEVPSLLGAYSASYQFRLTHFQRSSQSAARDQGDVVFVTSTDGGATWSPRQRVNDDPPGFVNEIPQLATDAHGNVHAAWYDRSGDTVHGIQYTIRYATSSDGGHTFTPSRAIRPDLVDWTRSRYGASSIVGDTFGFMATGDSLGLLYVNVADASKVVSGVMLPNEFRLAQMTDLDAILVDRTLYLSFTHAFPDPDIATFTLWHRDAVGDWSDTGSTPVVSGDRVEFTVVVPVSAEPGRYRVLVVPGGGTSRWGPEISPRVIDASYSPALFQLKSNPGRPPLSARLIPIVAGRILIQVFDVRGRFVRTLLDGDVSPPGVDVTWDGRASSGAPVASGRYFVRIRQGSLTRTIPVILIR